MKTSTHFTEPTFFAHPALRSLLDFNTGSGRSVAEIATPEIRFTIFHDSSADSYLIHYKRTQPSHEGGSLQGYIRCSSFPEILESLSEEMPAAGKAYQPDSVQKLPLSSRWLLAEPRIIHEDYRTRFIMAIGRTRRTGESDAMTTLLEKRAERWIQVLRPYALSA